jgi:pimeloyl-ACP methyl ester carboxylesterase
MGDEAKCEIARPRAATSAGSGASTDDGGLGRPLGRPRREVLRAWDGVRIEAAYEPFAGTANAGATERIPPAIVVAHGFSGSVDRPALRRAVQVFARYGAVITFSFRGHGNSGGLSTVGDREVLDLAAAVRWARSMGHERVATVGFSMGGSVVVRHGALCRPYGTDSGYGTGSGARSVEAYESRTEAVPLASQAGPAPAAAAPAAPPAVDGVRQLSAHSDAVVAVSAPARWYYRGTAPMRRLHWVIQRPLGRLISRYGLRTRIHPRDWDPVPLSPVAAASALSPTPLLVVHGDQDPYFPLDHPRSLAEAADPECSELWLIPGFGHAENAAETSLLHRIGGWITAQWPNCPVGPA